MAAADAAEPVAVAAASTSSTTTQRRNGTGRKIAVAILIVLSTIFVCTASVALWAQRTVFDTDAIVDATDSALDQPEVTAAISTYITDQIVEVTSQAQVLEKVLPSQLDALAPFIRGALTSRVAEQVQELVDSQPGRNLINNAVRVAHKSAVRLLEGDGLLSDSAFSVKDGKVNLDLTQVIVSVLDGLQQRGVIPSSVDLSSVGTGAHQEQVQKLADRFGITLPENFGQITVLDSARVDNASDTLATAQRAVVVVKRGLVLWTVLAIVLVVVTMLVTRTRRRTAVQLGLAVAALAIVLRVRGAPDPEGPRQRDRETGRERGGEVVRVVAHPLAVAEPGRAAGDRPRGRRAGVPRPSHAPMVARDGCGARSRRTPTAPGSPSSPRCSSCCGGSVGAG